MLRRVEIVDSNKTPVKWLYNIDALKSGSVFEFKPGVNIIIGPNGSGKSSLLELLYSFGLCKKQIRSNISIDCSELFSLFNNDEELLDGVKIEHDFSSVFFRLISQQPGEDSLSNIDNFFLKFNESSSSTGEGIKASLAMLLKSMFDQMKDNSFPVKKLLEIKEHCNDVFKERISKLVKYYKTNYYKELRQEDFEFTILMDEPDKNLDIFNLEEVYDLLCHRKEYTQVIAVIHNPVLINRLRKIDSVNIIELVPGYLNDVIKFVER